MKKPLAICTAALLLPTLYAEAPPINVIPLSVSVIPDTLPQRWEQNETGILVTLECRVDGEGIIVNDRFSRINEEYDLTVTDSAGASLGDLEAVKEGFSSMIPTPDSPTYTFRLGVFPSPECTSLTVKGTLPVQLLYGKAQSEPQTVAFKKGEKCSFENLSIQVTDAKKDSLVLYLSTSKADSPFELVFTDESGKVIKPDEKMRSHSRMNSDLSMEKVFTFDQPMEKVRISVVRWTESKRVDAPVHVELGLGLMRAVE